MTRGTIASDRSVLRLSGPDARDFLQGLVTNDVARLDQGPLYAAMLSPQGKYLFDFFLVPDGADILVDVHADRAAALGSRLALYRLRARVEIAATDLAVAVGLGAPPAGAFPDPRDTGLGWRALGPDPVRLLSGVAPLDPAEREALRIALGIPETGTELVPDESYILEMDFERLHGVDFRKGCYVGQEVTARMKHKTELRKGLARVRLEGPAPPPGTVILARGEAGDRPAGTLLSSAGGRALAYLRFDRADAPLSAGDARVTPDRQTPE